MVTLDAIPAIPAHVIWEEEANGRALVYNIDNDDMVSLNAVGTAIWKLCNGKRSVAEISRQLLERYRVSEAVCHQQTLALLEKLQTKNLLEWKQALSDTAS